MHVHMYEIDGVVLFFVLLNNLHIFLTFQQRQKSREQNFNSFLSDLEAKYSKTGGKSQKAKRGKKWKVYKFGYSR